MTERYTVVRVNSGWYVVRDGTHPVVWYAPDQKESADRQCEIFNDPDWQPPTELCPGFNQQAINPGDLDPVLVGRRNRHRVGRCPECGATVSAPGDVIAAHLRMREREN